MSGVVGMRRVPVAGGVVELAELRGDAMADLPEAEYPGKHEAKVETESRLTRRCNFRMDRDIWDWIQARAEKRGECWSKLVNRMLRVAVKKLRWPERVVFVPVVPKVDVSEADVAKDAEAARLAARKRAIECGM